MKSSAGSQGKGFGAYTPSVTGSGGGGPAPGGTIQWGPDFGGVAGDRYRIGAHTTNPANGVIGDKTIGVRPQMVALANLYNAQGIGVHIDTALGLRNDKTIGVQPTMPLLSVAYANLVAVQQTMPTLAVANAKTVGVHLSGSVVGAPFWQSVGLADPGSTTDIIVPKPSGLEVGDLMLAFIAQFKVVSGGVPIDFSAPSGWTAIQNQAFSGTTEAIRAVSYWKIATASDVSATDFTWVGENAISIGEIHRVNGAHATTPINASAVATVAAAALTPDPVSPAVTTTVANCLVFALLAHYHSVTDESHTPPASHVETSDHDVTSLGTFSGLTSDTRVFAAAASTGTATHNCTETVGTDGCMQRIAIAPGSLTIAS